MKLTGRNGVLRILDSAAVLHGVAPLDGFTVDVVKHDGVAVWANITTDVITDDLNYANNFLTDTPNKVYIGSTSKFAIIQFLKGGGANYAAGSGALIGYYFNGTNFASSLPGLVDGTSSGGDCFGQDGFVSFKPPRNWALGANIVNANLDADKYYIILQAASKPSPEPDADVLCPVEGQFFEVAFAAMDFSGPIGRKLQDEILVLDRNTMSARGHYIKGPDDPLYEPVPISFSCAIDDTYNKDDIMEALACGDPDSTYWTATGTSSKGDTKNDGTNSNPSFVDTSKKCVNVQIIWTGSTPIGMAFYECYFPPEEISLSESEEGITLSANGGCYGVIETIHGFGNRY